MVEFVDFLSKERNDSPHTVKAYERDVKDFAAFCTDYYGGGWSFAGVDRLAIRGWLGNMQQRGLAKRSAARALSALRTFYRFLNTRSEEHTSELQSPCNLVCRLLLEKKKRTFVSGPTARFSHRAAA